ncbi:hypothetical protein IMZ48_28050 [Candidatus Bathyarchaeota archaeon]|nr:hypothetical protein [Candidatus Bathyarchaeota archaeon]
MLFTYSPLDPSYTLAPTVGWTSIELSAGIVSACLPASLPALKWFIRAIGIRSLASTVVGLSSAGDTKLKTDGSRAFNHELSSQEQNTMRSKMAESRSDPKGDPFYRLSDDVDSDMEKGDGGDVNNFRPDKQRVAVTINTASQSDSRDGDSGDEVALNTLNRIHVQKELMQTSYQI